MTASTPEQALIQAGDAGIHQMAIPTPFAVGRVNAYLVEAERLTLVDVGPNSDRAFAELERHLADLGHRVEEIELVLITHGHIDHVGLVEAVVGRSRAEVAALDIGVDFLADFDGESAREDEFAVEIMRQHGVPASVAEALRSVSSSFRSFGAPTRVTHPFSDGAVIDLGDRQLQALHRPGHSPLDTIFFDHDNRYLFSGDHLLAQVSSNPLLTRPRREGEGRPHALVDYLDSFQKTLELDAEITLPGHGELILDHRGLIEARIRSHMRRKEKIFGLIKEQRQSAYELAQTLWGNVAVTQTFLCISEVLGHTDLLVAEGRITEVEGDPVQFEAIDGEGP
jgi:glyoxylase-like metal-dependent hydrolase (beta-lactamase superfamily II)